MRLVAGLALAGGLLAWAAWAGADFMEPCAPARSAALGGHPAALARGGDALRDQPAALGDLREYDASAGYQALFTGDAGTRMGAASLMRAVPLGQDGPEGDPRWGGLAFSWERFGGDNLQRDRVTLGWGAMQALPWGGRAGLGLKAHWLRQAFTLDEPLPGIDTGRLSSQAFDLGAGVQWRPLGALTMGLAGDQLASPDLGLYEPQRLPPIGRASAALRLLRGGPGETGLVATAVFGDGKLEAQGGLEWLPFKRLALRLGADARQLAAGTTLSLGGLRLDYACLFGMPGAGDASSFGPSHHVELGYSYRAATSTPTMAPSATATATPPPPPTAAPTPRPVPGRVSAWGDARVAALVARAAALKKAGRMDQSQRALDQALALHPGDPALAALKDSWRQGEIASARAAEELPAARRLGREALLQEAQGRMDLAQELWRAALRAEPGWDEARAGVRRCAEAAAAGHDEPRDARASRLEARGMQAYLDGDIDRAMAIWEEALMLDPGNSAVLNNLARARAERGAGARR